MQNELLLIFFTGVFSTIRVKEISISITIPYQQ